MAKQKFIGFMHLHKDWPPKPSEIDRNICRSAEKLGLMPKTILLRDEMPEIVMGKYKLEVIRVPKGGCPLNYLWIGVFMNDFAKGVGFE
jgi:proteasome lid subunit RPN8/RPN11